MDSRYKTSLNYAQLSQWCQEVADQNPDWVRLSSLGQSFEGRELWCLTLTNWKTGTDRERSAI